MINTFLSPSLGKLQGHRSLSVSIPEGTGGRGGSHLSIWSIFPEVAQFDAGADLAFGALCGLCGERRRH